jgi:undecaprenyl-diphosphatase
VSLLSLLEQIDLAVLHFVNQTAAAPWLDPFFLFLTDPPYREIWIAAFVLLLAIRGGKRGRIAAVLAILAVALADQTSATVLKPLVERTRPCFAHPDEVRLLPPRQARSPSFPSSHAPNASAVAVVLFTVRRWLGFAGLALAFLIAYSRPYVGVHYPSDTLGGAMLGAALGLGLIRTERWIRPRFVRWRTDRDAG